MNKREGARNGHIRLLIPRNPDQTQQGNRDVRYRLELGNIDVNERYDDMALVEIDTANPNIDWVLQDPNVIQVGYSQPPFERQGPPTDVFDMGKNGPPSHSEDRIPYTRSGRSESVSHPNLNLAETVIRPENSASEEPAINVIGDEETVFSPGETVPPSFRFLEDEFDFTDLRIQSAFSHFKGDGVPLGLYEGYYLPAEEMIIINNLTVAEKYQNTPIRSRTSVLVGDYLDEKYNREETLVLSFDGVMERSNKVVDDRVLEKDESIPSPANPELNWWRITWRE